MKKKTILLVEDEDRLRRVLQMVLQGSGYEVRAAANGQEAVAVWPEIRPDIVLTDLKMAPGDGLFVLAHGKRHDPSTPIILLTAFGTVATAVLAMKDGAFDYLTKPVDNDELLAAVSDALLSRRQVADFEELLGTSPAMQKVRRDIILFAATDSSVLISGESGTGKEIAARAIHQESSNPEGPFVRVNCAAIPADLLESELFGHVRGAFTGASVDREGAFARADHGTLFLDEIGDLPLVLQPKLLHAVEEKVITPLGSSATRKIRLKILSATNRNLKEMIEEKTFRRDLYYRLNRVHLHLPPVREREGDLVIFLDHFLREFCRRLNKEQLCFAPETLELLKKYTWPGNVREIKNVVERAVLTCEGGQISPEHLPSSILTDKQGKAPPAVSTATDLNGREQQLITKVLEECSWNQSEAARSLGITRNTLRYRIKKYGICKTR